MTLNLIRSCDLSYCRGCANSTVRNVWLNHGPPRASNVRCLFRICATTPWCTTPILRRRHFIRATLNNVFSKSTPPVKLGAAILSVQSFSHICFFFVGISHIFVTFSLYQMFLIFFIQDGRARQIMSYGIGLLLCVQAEIYMIPGESAHVLICSTLFNTEDSQGTCSTIQHDSRYHGMAVFFSHITIFVILLPRCVCMVPVGMRQGSINSFHRPHLLHVSGC